ncbi:MAG: hypothetical protein HYS20_00305 [Rhodocyclales bacterium]|nr:hypothetical protein [Rhodocyclales bacterium]
MPGNRTLGPGKGDTRRKALRSVATILARYELRKLKRLLGDFDNDIMLPLLLGEIALHNVGVLENGTEHEPEMPLRPCNAYSIAAATGLPRETVRRKIGRLVEQGWVEKCDNGHLYMTDRTLEHFSKLLQSRDLPELLDTAERVRALLGTAPVDER